MTRCWDAVVIGGGPAGSAAAIRLAEGGCSCLLLEREAFPRSRPGETLHPGVEPLLRQIDIWDEVVELSEVRPRGIRVSTAAGVKVETFGNDARGEWLGLTILRADLDHLLLEQAKRCGVVVTRQHVGALSVISGRVSGVVTRNGKIDGRVVIDAAGGSHLLARLLRLPVERSSPRLVATYGYVAGTVLAARDEPYIAFDSSGWTWVARIDSSLTHWTRLEVLPPRRSCRAESRPTDVAALPAVGPTRGADVTWRRVSQSAGPGYFIAGDAAAVIDPASSDGVIRSLLSGRLAGHLATLVLDGTVSEESATAQYNVWIHEQFAHRAAKLGEIYSTAFPGWRCP